MAYPKKSDADRWLHGQPTPSAAKVTESYVASGRPKFPKGLTSEQRPTFKRIVGLLEARRTVTPADAELIYLYAVLEDQWQQARAEIKRDGVICEYTRTDNNGKVFTTRKKNEACGVADSCSRQMFAILRELGLSPKSRDSVKPTGANPGAQVVPGSIADRYGHDLSGLTSWEPKPLVVPPPIEDEDER